MTLFLRLELVHLGVQLLLLQLQLLRLCPVASLHPRILEVKFLLLVLQGEDLLVLDLFLLLQLLLELHPLILHLVVPIHDALIVLLQDLFLLLQELVPLHDQALDLCVLLLLDPLLLLG